MNIYTSGDMAYLEAIWTGVGHIWASGFLKPVLASALMLNLLYGFLRWAFDPKQPAIASFWQSIVIYLIFFSTSTSVVLNKDNEAPRPIPGDFPIGFVVPASWLTTIGHAIATEVKSVVVAVNTGFGWSTNNTILEYGVEPLELLVRMRNQRVGIGGLAKSDLLSNPDDPSNADSGLSYSMEKYYAECVEKYLTLAKSDPSSASNRMIDNLKAALQAKDFWGKFLVDQSSWPIEIRLDGSSYMTNCSDAHNDIKNALYTRAKNFTASQLLAGIKSQDASATLIERRQKLEEVSGNLDPVGNADNVYALQQNLWTSSGLLDSCARSKLLGPEFTQACHQQFNAIQDRRAAEASKAESFKEMVGPLVTFLEGFIYLATPLFLIVIMFMGAASLKLMGKYMSALLWIVLMPICQVAVDVYLNVYFNRWYQGVLNADSAGTNMLSVASQESSWQQLESFIAFAGTAQAMVPALAMFLIFAGVHTLQGLGASASGAGAVSPGAITPHTTAETKGGVSSYSNRQAFQVQDEKGEYKGASVGKTTSVLNAHDSNVTLGLSNGSGVTKMITSAQKEASALEADVNNSYAHKYTEGISTGVKFDRSQAASKGFAKNEAIEASFIDALKESYKLNQDQVDALSNTLSFGVDGKGQLQISADAGIGTKMLTKLIGKGADKVDSIFKGLGLDIANPVDKDGKVKDATSAVGDTGLGLEIKGSASAGITMGDKDDKKTSTSQSASISSSGDQAISEAYKKTSTMLENWNDSHSYSDGGGETDTYNDELGVSGKTGAKYNQARERAEALAARRQQMLSTSVNTGDAIASISKQAFAFSNAIGANGQHSAIDAARDSLLESFGGDKLKGIDSRNITQEQADILNKEIDPQERATLAKLGLTLGDNGFVAGSSNFEDQLTTISRMSGKSEDDLKLLSDSSIDASTSPFDPMRGKYEQRRQEVIGQVFKEMNGLADTVAVDHADEALRAAGTYFTAVSDNNLGLNGAPGSGNFNDLNAYGQQLIDFSNTGLVQDNGKLGPVETDPKLEQVAKNGRDAIGANSNDLTVQLGNMDGKSAEALAKKKADLEAKVKAGTLEGLEMQNETLMRTESELDVPDKARKEVLMENMRDKQGALVNEVDKTVDISRKNMINGLNSIVSKWWDTGFTQKDKAMVQDPAIIEKAQAAFNDYSNLYNFKQDKIFDNAFFRWNSKDSTLRDIEERYDSSNPQSGMKEMSNFFQSKGYSAQESEKLATDYQDLRSKYDSSYSQVLANSAVRLDFMLIAGNTHLSDSTNPEDFKTAMLRYSNTASVERSGEYKLERDKP